MIMPREVTAKPLEFNDDLHPHAPAGSPAGGQFVSNGGTSVSSTGRGKLTYSGKRQGTGKYSGGGKSSTPPQGITTTTKYPTMRRGKPNDPAAVKQLQAMVRELKLADIAVDGNFGADTEAAVKAIQGALGMRQTGIAADTLMRRMHDAHTLSPCVDKSASQVMAMAWPEDDDDAEPEPVAAALGHDVTPGHDELHHYWTRGKGLAKWVNSPMPWTTLVAHLTKYVGPEKAKIYASRWFIEVFHFAAGSDLNRVTHGKPPRGKVVGPG